MLSKLNRPYLCPGRGPPCRWLLAFVAIVLLSGSVSAQPDSRFEYLQRFDTNGDGRVSLSEYQAYMSRGFRAMDRNGDGVLSASELPAGVRWRGPITLESHLRALARTFDLLDVNNDGYLDAYELTAPPP